MIANEFAEVLRELVGAAEDDGLERPAMIAVLAAEADEAGPVREAGPEGFAKAVGQLVIRATAAGLDRAEVGATLLEQAAAMCEAEAE